MLTPISVCSILFVSLSMLSSQAATSGRFRLQVDGKDTGFEQFNSTVGPGGITINSTSETRSGATARRVVTSTEYRDKRPARYSLEITTGSRIEKYLLTFTPSGVNISIEVNGRKTERTRPAGKDIVLLDKDVWHHYQILLARYDLKSLGKQSFRVFIPQAAFREYNAEVEYKGITQAKVGEEKKPAYRYNIILADGFEVNAVADQTGRPFSIEVPAEKMKVVLE